jgi:S1-C subfamily serine protease
VRGAEDRHGVNQTLRGDIARFGKAARVLVRAARKLDGAGPVLATALARDLRLLARYHRFIAARWSISAGTERSFRRARAALADGIAVADPALAGALAGLSLDELGDAIDARGALQLARDNPHLSKVDDEIADPEVRAAIRAVQPATVRLGGGSGVNLAARGLILTAAHVIDDESGAVTVTFPDGTEVDATTIAIDHALDLAVLEVDDGAALPFAAIADAAPEAGTEVVVIGQPGAYTPDGELTHYQPWHVSTGEIRGFRGDPLDDQSLGGTKHDAWTYWGHSGSPLFDHQGRIVALHNSWDSRTAMRHAVRHEAIVHFLDEHGVTARISSRPR